MVRGATSAEVMGGFDVVVLQGICANYFDKRVAPLLAEVQYAQDQLCTQVKELAASVEQKGPVEMSAKLEALAASMAQKEADISRLDEVLAQMDTKASSEVSTEEPSTDQFESWLNEAEQKCREVVAEALAPIEERQEKIDRILRSHGEKMAQYKSFESDLQSKANIRDVPTLAQFQRLSASVEKKANASKVPTVTQFSELQEIVESKVNASGVPTLAEFQELRAAVKKKANASSVPCAGELEKVLEEVKRKANIEDVEKALDEKANSSQVPLTSTVDNLASVMERKLAFLAARLQKTSESVDNVLSQAMVCYIPNGMAYGQAATGTWVTPSQGDTHPANGTWVTPSQAPQVGGDGLAPGGWGEASNKAEGDSCS